MKYSVQWPAGNGIETQVFDKKTEALKAIRALKGVRIRPSKMHRGIVHYMSPLGQIALVELR